MENSKKPLQDDLRKICLLEVAQNGLDLLFRYSLSLIVYLHLLASDQGKPQRHDHYSLTLSTSNL